MKFLESFLSFTLFLGFDFGDLLAMVVGFIQIFIYNYID